MKYHLTKTENQGIKFAFCGARAPKNRFWVISANCRSKEELLTIANKSEKYICKICLAEAKR